MTKDEAMKLALEALEENHHLIEEHERPEYLAQYDRVISAVSKALAEQPAQQELVAWQTVPTDPSIAACITGSMAVGGAIDGKQAALVYAAMLNAAPQPAQQEPVEFKCVVIDNHHHPDGITFEQWVKPAQQCVACEGKPSQENNPCAVCGKPAQQEPVAWPHEQEPVASASDDFLQGICVALQAVTGSGDSVLWREIVETAGADDLFQFAAHIEPEEWELAGFGAFAKSEMRRNKPKKLIAQPAQQEQKPVAGVVIRDNVPTLLQDRHIKQTDERLYKSPPAQQEQGELRRLHEANQAMLVALKDLMDGTGDMTSKRIEKARAAIAKGEKT